MFELVLSWVFFHELSHIVQRHHLLKGGPNQNIIEEMESSTGENIEKILSQAREILADAEAVDLTLKYMGRNQYFTYSNSYLFMFGLCLMFHRFYGAHSDNFDSVPGIHPHPVVRHDFSQSYLMMAIIDHLLKSGAAANKESAALPLIYISTRASSVAGVLWSHRYELKSEGLPSFMKISTETHQESRTAYKDRLREAMSSQLITIAGNHLIPENFLTLLANIPDFNKQSVA